MELLEAMRACLRDLNNVRLVRSDDPHLIRLKQHLREKIAEVEAQGSDEHHPYQRAA
jgi:hypothetical protein